jgi:SAM-dependent methyltransferase
VAENDLWTDQAFLRDSQYKTDVNLAARASIYAYQHPRIDLPGTVLDLAEHGSSGTVVDVGCGNGAYLAELARRGFAGRLLGIDLAAGMLAAARSRLAGVENPAALVNADATTLPLRDGVADLALAPHMLYHVPDPVQAVRELRRVTRSGGRVVIVLNGTDHMRQIREAVMVARGDASGRYIERVTLDDGESLARELFANVTRHDLVAEVRVPVPGPVADYIRSLPDTISNADPDKLVEKAMAVFPTASDHTYEITSHCGCLVCEVG